MTLVSVNIIITKDIESLILGACNCNAKMCRLVWVGYIVAGQATLYHRYVIILLLLLLLLQYKNSYFCTNRPMVPITI